MFLHIANKNYSSWSLRPLGFDDRLGTAVSRKQAWYQAALNAPWIEPAHDEEVLAFGVLGQDDRSPA
jgi:hypothetical protein